MKKYFLLSVAALMISGTANATTDYAEVTAKATIEVAGTFSCPEITFGTIVVKQNNAPSTVRLSIYGGAYDITGDIISVTGENVSDCEYPSGDYPVIDEHSVPTSLTLTGEESSETIFVTDIQVVDETTFDMKLNIPANVTADTYIGTFTVTTTY